MLSLLLQSRRDWPSPRPWVIHFSIVITRTIGIVDVGENRGVEAAPIVSESMRENAVYSVKYYRREGYSLEPKKGVGIP